MHYSKLPQYQAGGVSQRFLWGNELLLVENTRKLGLDVIFEKYLSFSGFTGVVDSLFGQHKDENGVKGNNENGGETIVSNSDRMPNDHSSLTQEERSRASKKMDAVANAVDDLSLTDMIGQQYFMDMVWHTP